MTRELGSYNTATTRTHVRFQFSTHAAAGGNEAPSSAFEAADLRIYRAAGGAAYSATQRSSAAGITMTSPFDSLVGVHDVVIDLTDDTDAGFYAAGYRYSVVLSPDETIGGETITGVVLAEFEIGPPPVNVTQVAGVDAPVPITGTAQSGTTTTLTDTALAHASADHWKGYWLLITSGSIADETRLVTGSTTGGVLTVSPAFTAAVSTNTYELIPSANVALPPSYDLYHADIQTTIDDSNSQDEYTITWFKNGARVTSGITVPTLQVIKRADGTDLIASTTPTQIGATGSYKHDATTSARLTAGESAIAVASATIDGSTRSFSKLVGRDS
jgi:hypothetical protein